MPTIFNSSGLLTTLGISSTFTVTGSMGYTKISVLNNGSAGNVTITWTLGNGVVIASGRDWTWISNSYPLDGIIITTDSSATAQITAN